MTTVKIRPIGNSLGVILPKEMLVRLNVRDGDTLYLTETPDGSMRLSPYDPAFETQIRAARESMVQFRNALRELAK